MGIYERYQAKKAATQPDETNLSRRNFIVASLSAAGGLAIGVSFAGIADAMQMAPQAWDKAGTGAEINAWIVINPDDTVTIRMARGEMGQGVFTSLPMIVAEELACDWAKVKSEYASGNRNVVEKGVYKSMITGGSSSVRTSLTYLQQAGASARERLIHAAAAKWAVPTTECRAENGAVIHDKSKRSLNYGALAAAAATVSLAEEPKIKTPDQYTLIGQPTARLDTKVKVNGQAIFGIDAKVPGMVYATVMTCPVPGGTVKSFDDKPVLALRGVTHVVPLGNKGVAVVADSFWRAKKAADALQVDWDYGAGAGTSSAQFNKEYRDALNGPAVNSKAEGDVATAFKSGKLIEAVYEAPHLAHAAMEPLNCTAHVQPNRVDIWIGTQAADMAVNIAAQVSGVPVENVFVHNCYLGGGFGRRAVFDEMPQAIMISKIVGKPVKLIWTREEDMRHDRYRPQAAIRFKATLGADGMPVAIDARTAVGSISKSLGMSFGKTKEGLEPMATEGLDNMPYAIANVNVDCILKNTHIPVMFWRSVGSSQNAFAVESFIDELAHEAGQDPYQFRRKMLAGRPDFIKVLDTLAEKSNWGQKMPAGKGRGMAIHEAFGTIVGEVVEVAVDAKGKVKCERVVVAVDCGHVVNPRTVEMQMESGVIYGLTAALFDEITVKNGVVEQGNFDSYPIVRMADAPKIETYLALSGGDKWGGIGEPGTPPIAPALCNAIFAATGQRIRQLPVRTIDLNGRAKA
jgi:isoquinoline 1-oxidoreductase beta subunit